MATTVVHCKKAKYDVYIGRPSILGNPFKLNPGDDRDAVIAKYRKWLMGQPHMLARLQTCHGDVLAELADATKGGA